MKHRSAMRPGHETVHRQAADTVGSSLDHLIGSWSDAEADEIERALKHFETVRDERAVREGC